MKNSEELEKKIKEMYQQKIEPDSVLEKETIRQMKEKSVANKDETITVYDKRIIRGGGVSMNKTWLKPVMAMMGIFLLLGVAVTGNAENKGNYIKRLFATGGNRYSYSNRVSDYECDILSYEICDEVGKDVNGDVVKTTEELEITPVQICSDGFHSYVIAKVTGKNGVILSENMYLDDAGLSLYTDNLKDYYHVDGSSSGETKLKYDEEENAVYYGFHCTGTDLKEGQNAVFTIGGWDWWDVDEKSGKKTLHKGRYQTHITTKIKKAEYKIVKDATLGEEGEIRLSAMGLCISTDFGDSGNKVFMDKNLFGDVKDTQEKIYVTLKDGRRVDGIIHGASSSPGEKMYAFVTFEDISPIPQIQSIHMGDVTIDVK